MQEHIYGMFLQYLRRRRPMSELNDFVIDSAGYSFVSLVGCDHQKAVLAGAIPNELLDEMLGLENHHTFLLYGEQGNGKSTIALAFGGELAVHEYTHICISNDNTFDTEERISLLEQLKNMLYENQDLGYYLQVEDVDLMEDPDFIRALYSLLTFVNRDDLRLITLITSQSLEKLPASLLQLGSVIYQGCPDMAQRKVFFQRRLGNSIPMASNCGFGTLAELTENYNYEKLTRFVFYTCLMIKSEAMNRCGTDVSRLQKAIHANGICLDRRKAEMITDNIAQEFKMQTTEQIAYLPGMVTAAEATVAAIEEAVTKDDEHANFSFEDIANMNFDDL